MRAAGRIRKAAVAGRFYPGNPEELQACVSEFLASPAAGSAPRKASGVVVPHAGYVYSGETAGRVFAAIELPQTAIVLCPNHTGVGAPVAVYPSGSWEFPGGEVPIAEELAAAIIEEFPLASADESAHRGEHAIEVELPFLLARRPDISIVPIVLSYLRRDDAIDLGRALHRAATRIGVETMVVASSDMSHYLPDDEARAVDAVALEPLLEGDPELLYDTVRQNDISMCGIIPVTTMLSFARERGRVEPELVEYTTSARAFGDRSRVVGYAGVIV